MLVRLAMLTLATASLSACSTLGADGGEASGGRPSPRFEATSEPAAPAKAEASHGPDIGPVRLRFTAGDIELVADLRDTSAARDLLAQVPLTVTMSDHGGVEKTGALPLALSLAGEPEGADPDVGDLGYYAPSNDLVLYYGDQSYYEGIVILGRLQGDIGSLQGVEDGLVVQVRRS